MDRNRTPTNIYLDLSKAFNSLSHGILLNKLQHCGLCDVAQNLLGKVIYQMANNLSNIMNIAQTWNILIAVSLRDLSLALYNSWSI